MRDWQDFRDAYLEGFLVSGRDEGLHPLPCEEAEDVRLEHWTCLPCRHLLRLGVGDVVMSHCGVARFTVVYSVERQHLVTEEMSPADSNSATELHERTCQSAQYVHTLSKQSCVGYLHFNSRSRRWESIDPSRKLKEIL